MMVHMPTIVFIPDDKSLTSVFIMESYLDNSSILKEILPKDDEKNTTCNVDLQQNCLSAKNYNVAYVRSMETNRFRVNFGSEGDASRLCDIACTQDRVRNNKLLPESRKYHIFSVLFRLVDLIDHLKILGS